MMSPRPRFRALRASAGYVATLLMASAIFAPASAENCRRGPTHRLVIGQRPFAASSSWNTPIAETAVHQNVRWPPGALFGVSWSRFSPAIHVASCSDPVVSVRRPASWGYPEGVVKLRMPPDARGALGSDGELLVIDGDTVHNFWQFKRSGATEAAANAYGAANVVTGSGWGQTSPFLGAGIVAAGSSQLAGMLVQAETDRGEIAHALQIAIDESLARPGHVGEAISGDGYNPDGLFQEGQRLAIAPNAPMPEGMSPLGDKVFRALQGYGAFVIDKAGGATNLRAQANAYDQPTIAALQRDWERMAPMLERVTSANRRRWTGDGR
jgi:hypothetical protein